MGIKIKPVVIVDVNVNVKLAICPYLMGWPAFCHKSPQKRRCGEMGWWGGVSYKRRGSVFGVELFKEAVIHHAPLAEFPGLANAPPVTTLLRHPQPATVKAVDRLKILPLGSRQDLVDQVVEN